MGFFEVDANGARRAPTSLRRSHTKSRKGCKECKQSHLKCDEALPSCSNCVRKERQCNYQHQNEKTSTDTDQSASSLRPPAESLYAVSLPKWCFGSPDSDERSLELQLMYRWSTSTAIDLCKNSKDKELWTQLIMQDCFDYRFMMDSILGLTALDIAANGGEEILHQWSQIALRYQNRASEALRGYLSNITAKTHQPLLMASLTTLIMALSLPLYLGGNESLLDSVNYIFELHKGSIAILDFGLDSIKNGPMPIDFDLMLRPPPESLDKGIASAIAEFNLANDAHYELAKNRSREVQWKARELHAILRKAMLELEDLWVRSGDPENEFLCLAWPLLAGEIYAESLQAREPITLLALLYWAVLVEKTAGSNWLARGAGIKLVQEVTAFLPIDESHPWGNILSWARSEVGI